MGDENAGKNDLIGLKKIVHISLHSFPKASELDYAESTYLGPVDEYEHLHCTLIQKELELE